MKNSYKKFAYYYDEVITNNTNYDLWVEFVEPYINKNSNILDLACGTGTFITMLKLKGYNVSGLDLSDEIIEIAKEKAKLNRLSIPFYIADMTNFKLSEKFDLITCFFDSINFLKEKTDIKKMLDSVYKHLNNDGYFIFDIFSKELMKEYENNIIDEDFETFKIKWNTKHDNNKLIHNIKLIEDDNIIEEKYYEYYYDIKDLLDKRFKLIKISGDFNDDLEAEDERILIILQKNEA